MCRTAYASHTLPVVLAAAVLLMPSTFIGWHWGIPELLGYSLARMNRPKSDAALLQVCEEHLQELDKVHFTVEKRFDLTETFGALPPDQDLSDLLKAKQRFFINGQVDHMFLSDKVAFYRLLQTTDVPMATLVWSARSSELQPPEGVSPQAPHNTSEACARLAAQRHPVIIKAAHCVAGSGITLVPKDTPCHAVQDHLRRCLELRPVAKASHMADVAPGVIMQQLFDEPSRGVLFRLWRRFMVGEPSPPQLKVDVYWGRVFVCHARKLGGLTYIFRNGTMAGAASRAVLQSQYGWIVQKQLPHIVSTAEALASTVGMPSIRVDFFLSRDGRWVLNELEVVSGIHFSFKWPQPVTRCMARLWRAPYQREWEHRHNAGSCLSKHCHADGLSVVEQSTRTIQTRLVSALNGAVITSHH